MPGNNDRIIFQHGEEQPISEEEFEQSQTPYEQTETLIKRLVAWTAIAAKELEQYGYYRSDDDDHLNKDVDLHREIKVLTEEESKAFDPRKHIEKIIFAEEISGYDVTIYHYPGVIPNDATAAERAACHVLKTAMALWKAIFTDNKPLIANLGLEFGLAVASAHAMPFEKLTIIGDTCKSGPKVRGEALAKKLFQDCIKANYDKVKHITRHNQMLDIPELIPLIRRTRTKDYDLKTVAGWFGEIYPGQFKRGRG